MNVNVVVSKCLLLSSVVFTLMMILHLDVFFCILKDPLENEMMHLKGLSLKTNKQSTACWQSANF